MPATFTDILKIIDKQGFHFSVTVEHHPNIGLSIAFLNGSRIAQFEYGRILLPTTDDDLEWETYQQNFYEGAGGAALDHFEYECKNFINNQNQLQ